MANIAQTVNVLQALIFTKGEKMLLTPTYHIYDMYKAHHDALMIPLEIDGPDYIYQGQSLPALSASASRMQDQSINISLVNIDPNIAIGVTLKIKDLQVKSSSGTLLTSERMNSHNTFDNPHEVVPVKLDSQQIKEGVLEVTLPAHSVVMLNLK